MELLATDLVCHRGGRPVFSNVSLRVSSGQALVVRGPNGAGKSSLLRVLAGLLRAVGGSIVLTGGDPQLTLTEQAHYLGHQDALKPALSLTENLGFWIEYLGGGTMAPDAALAALGLEAIADLPAGYLSEGQRRRLAIARLIACPRPIWLLDEPTTALDQAAQGGLADIMRRHLADGGLIVAATHGPLGLDGANELILGGAH